MNYTKKKKELLRGLPKVDELLSSMKQDGPKSVKLRACRQAIEELRQSIMEGSDNIDPASMGKSAAEAALVIYNRLMGYSLVPVINGTGVVIHTNLGRSLLPPSILDHMARTAVSYSNLEYDLEAGKRGSRYSHVEELLCELTGAESALVVNNNAAAVLIVLETLARGREAVVSRGELVEIGGSFRIPDVMARSGARLKEVGATNRTHLKDYQGAIGPETALLMKVHQSNFQVVGFTKAVSIRELSQLARSHGIPLYEDLGSGNLMDFSRYGLLDEPMVQDSLAQGADVVSFSGDKLLGGPQAGIIVGKKELVDRIKRNPLNRAVRIDKLTLSALEGILRLYRDPDVAAREIPTLRMLTLSHDQLRRRAQALARGLRNSCPQVEAGTEPAISRVGGGALPLQELKSRAVWIRPLKGSSGTLEAHLRLYDPPIITRAEEGKILVDVRTLRPGDDKIIVEAVSAYGNGQGPVE